MEKQRGRKAVVIELDEEERQTLERWIRRRSTAQGLAMRSRIVLGAAEGRTNVDIAAEVGCSSNTVSKWRNRFARRGVDGLYDNPRPGPPRRIDDAKVEEVVVKTLEETPRDATHWSTRSMANAVGPVPVVDPTGYGGRSVSNRTEPSISRSLPTPSS